MTSRYSMKSWAKPEDTIRIGPYKFVLGQEQMAQFDETGGLEVEAVRA